MQLFFAPFLALASFVPNAPAPDYSLQAIRYASAVHEPVADLVMGAR
jgi:hypothetical protein